MLNSPWLPRLLRLNIIKTTMCQASLWSSSVLTTVKATKRQNCELERENGGECCWSEKAARDGAGPVVETLAQDRSSMDREMQYECAGGHWRSYAQLGRTCGKDGLQRNLCEGSEMSRPSLVDMETAPLERNGEGPSGLAHTHSGSKSTGGRTWLLVRGLQVCWKRRRFVENCPGQCGVGVHFAQNRGSWKQFSKCGKSLVLMVPGTSGPMCVRHDWDGCRCCNVLTSERICEREAWRALGALLSVSSQL